MLLQSERIIFSKAYQMLHDAKKDMQTIYYRIEGQIGAAESTVTELRKNGRFNHDQLGADNVLSLATRRAIVPEIDIITTFVWLK